MLLTSDNSGLLPRLLGTAGDDNESLTVAQATSSPGGVLLLRGDDTITGSSSDDLLYGSRGEDDLNGEDGNDRLLGNRDTDFIDGGDGNDIFYGGKGTDLFSG